MKVTRGSRRFVAVGLDRAPARPAGVSEEPSFRKGRAHDRIAVAEVGRTASSSWTHAATGDRSYVTKRNAARGNPRGASERPPDGRRFGSSVPAGTVTGSRGRVVSAARSQTPPHFGERGSPPVGESRANAPSNVRAQSGGQAVCGDGSVRGWKARSTSREEERPPRKESQRPTHPKCVGRRETRQAFSGPGNGTAPGDHRSKRGCP